MNVFASTSVAVHFWPGVNPETSLVVFVVAPFPRRPCCAFSCAARWRVVFLSILDNCGIMDSDLDDVARCIDVFGRDTMTRV